MPLSRLLLLLCGLLLAVAVTAVSAAAPLYGEDEVVLSYWITPTATTHAAQVAHCASFSGAIVPMVTDAIYTLTRELLDSAGATTFIAYAGGSSILSTSACTTETPTLSCIWYWDQGRYATIANAANFFIGNRDPKYLTGASMISTSVANYWRVVGVNERCPCEQMQRYVTLLRTNSGSPFWTDSSSIAYSYEAQPVGRYRTLCAVERLTTTTTTAEPSKESGLNLPLVIGLSVGVGIALFITFAVIVSLVCCGGCSCLAGSPAVAATSVTHNAAQLEYDGELQGALSRRGSMSRASSFHSSRMGMDDMGNRSFHDGPLRKNGTGHYSSARGFVDAVEPWQNGEEMAPFATPQYMQSYPSASMGAAPPPGPGTMPPQMMPEQMMPQQQMPPQMMPQQQMPPQMMPQQQMPPQMMPMQQQMPRNGSQTW